MSPKKRPKSGWSSTYATQQTIKLPSAFRQQGSTKARSRTIRLPRVPCTCWSRLPEGVRGLTSARFFALSRTKTSGPLHIQVMPVVDSPGAVLRTQCTLSRPPVYDCLEVRIALLRDLRVARGGLRLPRELLPHSAARDDRHHQLGLAEPHLQVPSASKHQGNKTRCVVKKCVLYQWVMRACHVMPYGHPPARDMLLLCINV